MNTAGAHGGQNVYVLIHVLASQPDDQVYLITEREDAEDSWKAVVGTSDSWDRWDQEGDFLLPTDEELWNPGARVVSLDESWTCYLRETDASRPFAGEPEPLFAESSEMRVDSPSDDDYEDCGPVLNPDGTPTEFTRQMLGDGWDPSRLSLNEGRALG